MYSILEGGFAMQKIIIDNELLLKLYNEDELSTDKIAELLGASRATISRRLSNIGVVLRGGGANKGRVSRKKGTIPTENKVDKEAIHKAYYIDKLSKREISAKFLVSFKTLNKLFESWGWESRTHLEQSSLHNKTYKAGKNLGKQNKNYHYIYSKVAFDYYDAECMECKYDRIKSVLEIHHIDGDRSNNEPENLMILCPTCHKELHYHLSKGE